MEIIAAIPARMGASRFPGKPLHQIAGRPMLEWVVDAVRAAGVERIVVATPDQKIALACERIGVECEMTSPDCATGTDRIAELAISIRADAYINVQGDEPLMPPETIRVVAETLQHLDDELGVASAYGVCSPEDYDDPAVVSVATDSRDRALYFSRHALPSERNPRQAPVKRHIGIYGYTRESLLAFPKLAPGPLEIAESLEQLRFLEHGYGIQMAQAVASPLAVDTPEQAAEVERIMLSSSK